MKSFVIYLVLLLFASNIIAQEVDRQKMNLKGNIVSIHTREYKMVSKFGEYIKKSEMPLSESWECFNKFGNKVILKKGNKNDSLGISKTSCFVLPGKEKRCLHYIYNANQKHIATYSLSHHQIESGTTLLTKIVTDTIQKGIFFYDVQEKLIEYNSYEKNKGAWLLTQKEKHSYSPAGEKISYYNSNGELISEKLIEKGNKERKETIKMPIGKTVHHYNLKGFLLKSETFIGGGNGVATEVIYYKYNSNGDILYTSNQTEINIDYKSPEQHLSKKYFEYKYDKFGNWIIRDYYNQGELETREERDILYADSAEEVARMLNDIFQKTEQEQQKYLDTIYERKKAEKEKQEQQLRLDNEHSKRDRYYSSKLDSIDFNQPCYRLYHRYSFNAGAKITSIEGNKVSFALPKRKGYLTEIIEFSCMAYAYSAFGFGLQIFISEKTKSYVAFSDRGSYFYYAPKNATPQYYTLEDSSIFDNMKLHRLRYTYNIKL